MPDSFDAVFLKSLTDELSGKFEKQTVAINNLVLAVSNVDTRLDMIKERLIKHDTKLSEHSDRIRQREIGHAACDAPKQMTGVWANIKRLNAFMDLKKEKDGIDTRVIDTHAQQIQRAAEMAIPRVIPMRDAFIKVLPWVIVVAIFSVVVTTLILTQSVTGQQVRLPSLPALDITNSSSQGAK